MSGPHVRGHHQGGGGRARGAVLPVLVGPRGGPGPAAPPAGRQRPSARGECWLHAAGPPASY
eukprot:11419910-Alexandrium_andersonii.AAC.1